MSKWIRTCQECKNKQEDEEPNTKSTSAYLDRKCKKCKSMGLDYGHTDYEDEILND